MNHQRRNSPESVRELRMLNHKITNEVKMDDLRRRMGKMKIAIRYESSFGPDLDALDAFKNKQKYQSFAGKGKKKTLKFESTGKELKLHGHIIARHVPKGIEVSNAGHDTGLTYSSIKGLGINARANTNGRLTLHNKDIDVNSGEFVLVPHKEISKTPINYKQTNNRKDVGKTVTDQMFFNRGVSKKESEEQGRKGLPLSSVNIQPHEQEIVNDITGIKSPLGKEILGTKAHHIFPKSAYPELRKNLNNGVMLPQKEHSELHRLNPSIVRNRLSKLKFALITPIVLKKKKPRVISKVSVKQAMEDNTRYLSADALADKTEEFLRDNPTWEKFNGTLDPYNKTLLDATIPQHAMRSQEMYGHGNGKIALNSITDTRKIKQTDVKILRSQLKEIEQGGFTPAVGIFDGSLEATKVLSPTTDAEALDDLLEHQRSTGIIDANTQFRIVDSPKFREN